MSTEYFSIYLCHLQFLSSVVYRSFTSLVKFIPGILFSLMFFNLFKLEQPHCFFSPPMFGSFEGTRLVVLWNCPTFWSYLIVSSRWCLTSVIWMSYKLEVRSHSLMRFRLHIFVKSTWEVILGASYSFTRHPLSECLVIGDAKSDHVVKVMLQDLCMVSCILHFAAIIFFVRWFFGSVQMTHFPVILFTYLFWYPVLILACSVRVAEWYIAISIILSAFMSWDSSIKMSFSVSTGLPMSSDICIFF